MSLLVPVVKAVENAYLSAGAVGVEAVGLRVGSLSGALPEALQAAWPLAVAGSVVDGARLDIEEVPAAVWCPTCATEQLIDAYFALKCPACQTPTGALTRGREFDVRYAEFITPDAG